MSLRTEQRPFIVDPMGQSLAYAELVQRLAAAQPFRGVCRARNAAAILYQVALALWRGRRLLLVDPQLTAGELAQLGLDAEAAVETLAPIPIEDVDALITRCRAGEAFELELLTSGSTGLPKRVAHRLSGLTRFLRTSARHAEDVWGLCYNPTHIAGVQVFLQAFLNGNTMVDLFGLPPATVRQRIAEHGVTHLSATPTFYRLLHAEPGEALTQVRAVTLGGEGSEPALHARLREVFPAARIRNLYASTEAGTLFASDGDTFLPPAGLAHLIAIEQGTLRLHRSLLGEFQGGAKAPEWYDTGDKVEIVSAEPRRFRFVGRERDWINVGGEKVNPEEIEAHLAQVPGVTAARVFGRRNSVVGQILCAEVVSSEAPDERAIRDFLAARLHALKVPRLITFVSALPSSRTGKLLRS